MGANHSVGALLESAGSATTSGVPQASRKKDKPLPDPGILEERLIQERGKLEKICRKRMAAVKLAELNDQFVKNRTELKERKAVSTVFVTNMRAHRQEIMQLDARGNTLSRDISKAEVALEGAEDDLVISDMFQLDLNWDGGFTYTNFLELRSLIDKELEILENDERLTPANTIVLWTKPKPKIKKRLKHRSKRKSVEDAEGKGNDGAEKYDDGWDDLWLPQGSQPGAAAASDAEAKTLVLPQAEAGQGPDAAVPMEEALQRAT